MATDIGVNVSFILALSALESHRDDQHALAPVWPTWLRLTARTTRIGITVCRWTFLLESLVWGSRLRTRITASRLSFPARLTPFGDPVNNIDPTGLTVQDCDWTGCAFNAAGAAASLTGDDIGSFSMGGISFTGVLWADEAQNEAEYNAVVQAAIAAASQAMNTNSSASSGPNPDCVKDAITVAAEATGPGVANAIDQLTSRWVQIVGEDNPNGGTYGETELNFSGTPGPDGTVQDLIDEMCGAGYANNNQCGGVNSTWLVGSPHSGFTGNFRSPGLLNSVQINTNVAKGTVQIDVDPFNPSALPILGLVLDGVLQVLPNKITGGDNTYGCNP